MESQNGSMKQREMESQNGSGKHRETEPHESKGIVSSPSHTPNQRNSQSGQGSTCSRCLAIETNVTPLAWTLSTLGQTNHDSVKEGRSLRSEMNLHSTDTNELLKQYRYLQVGMSGVDDVQTRKTSEQPVVIKSLIHGWGLFANCVYRRGQMVIEFVGEVLNQEVTNQREEM